eukprot:SAG25_NODE_154_length_13563_cov_44.588978_18_plen_206_part_00
MPKQAAICRWAHGTTDPQNTSKVASYEEYATACGHDGQSLGHISSLVNPAVSLLFNLTREPSYATEIHLALSAFAALYLNRSTSISPDFHCYETVNAYRVVVEAGAPPQWNVSMLSAFKRGIAIQCKPMPVSACAAPGAKLSDCHGTAGGVWNHGIDSALQSKLSLVVFPDLDCELSGVNCTFWNWSVDRLWRNWLHGHALMENG